MFGLLSDIITGMKSADKYMLLVSLKLKIDTMALFERDYKNITKEEQKNWDKVKEEEVVKLNGKKSKFRKSLYHKYPKAVKHYLSLFPNQFLDPTDLTKDQTRLIKILSKFDQLLSDKKTTEQDVLNFIREESAYFIVDSILKRNYQFGHHSLYLFPEFQLSASYKADYVLVGQNSDGYHFVFIEFENPFGNITRKDGSFGETIRKGIIQIDDWELWLEENFSHLRTIFEKELGDSTLPREFSVFDKSRVHFVVVAGKREDYTKKTYRLRRQHSEQRKILVIHYDNLIDYTNQVIGDSTY
jgi:hypothetical protein